MKSVLAEKISNFEPTDENWLELEVLFEAAFADSNPSIYYSAIFKLFERYPNENGAGVFWSALHGMEKMGNYETELLRSFRWFPNEMSKIMLMRMRNSGISSINGNSIEKLIGNCASITSLTSR